MRCPFPGSGHAQVDRRRVRQGVGLSMRAASMSGPAPATRATHLDTVLGATGPSSPAITAWRSGVHLHACDPNRAAIAERMPSALRLVQGARPCVEATLISGPVLQIRSVRFPRDGARSDRRGGVLRHGRVSMRRPNSVDPCGAGRLRAFPARADTATRVDRGPSACDDRSHRSGCPQTRATSATPSCARLTGRAVCCHGCGRLGRSQPWWRSAMVRRSAPSICH